MTVLGFEPLDPDAGMLSTEPINQNFLYIFTKLGHTPKPLQNFILAARKIQICNIEKQKILFKKKRDQIFCIQSIYILLVIMFLLIYFLV